ncbi:ferrochelatase [Caminibacter mediatlanticus]|uniref:Ferrochelatase n=1 Tax=Caminibacter mediatlanticus TB-2 TaxID=391592 RepID=A0AAI9AG68_9BACT|nr:ferrochelatase [Caminibacter mediatlanticus]EDM23078.1 ferrochelatase [Caminibacter mediatlanticus TB-2]
MKRAIILHNMGGARNKDELREFLLNMFKDKRILNSPFRKIIAPIIANLRYKKVWENYKKIGGSRIYTITENLCNEMQKYTDYEVVYAMRYTKPYLNKIIHKYEEIIFLPLYPHYSFTTFESCLDDLKNTNFKGKVKIINPFFENEKFNEIIKENILKEVDNPKEWNLIFSAHGIPKKLINKGDKYYSHILSHVEILKKKLSEFKSINLAFQSRFGPLEWLKPYLNEELKKYKNENVLVYPLSFMIDNSETDLELSIEYKELAKEYGIKNYKVVKCPNDDEKVAKFLVELANESSYSKS